MFICGSNARVQVDSTENLLCVFSLLATKFLDEHLFCCHLGSKKISLGNDIAILSQTNLHFETRHLQD